MPNIFVDCSQKVYGRFAMGDPQNYSIFCFDRFFIYYDDSLLKLAVWFGWVTRFSKKRNCPRFFKLDLEDNKFQKP